MKKFNARWQLVIYDILILFVVDLLLLVFYRSNEELSLDGIVLHAGISFVCVFTARIFGSIYRQMLPYCDRAYVTKVHITPESDTFFTNLDEDSQWYPAETLQSGEENGISYEMLLYKRK